jgi:hypothetical protein
MSGSVDVRCSLLRAAHDMHMFDRPIVCGLEVRCEFTTTVFCCNLQHQHMLAQSKVRNTVCRPTKLCDLLHRKKLQGVAHASGSRGTPRGHHR